MNKSLSIRATKGFTLIELLVAAAMLAFILIAAERSITTAQRSAEISEKRAQALRDIDRVWVVLENDLRNVISMASKTSAAGNPLYAMQIDTTDVYRLQFIRAGQANLLNLPRTEVLRVGLRLEDEVLWRDTWIDPYNPDPELARPQQLMDNVEEFEVLALPRAPVGRSIESGPWLDSWPEANAGQDPLPLSLELTIRFKDERELKRFITLSAG